MEKLKVGVLGLGTIFHRVMADFGNAENCELYALAARDLDRARAEAKKYGAAKAYGSYEDLLKDPEVELVYIATPNCFHREHTLLCLNHGKHVLCEKPIAMNAREAEEMIACAREKGLFLMEGMWTRFLPVMRAFMARYETGEFGKIRHITGDFAFAAYPGDYDPKARLFNPALGGGALMDVGPYVLSIGAMLLGTEPESLQCTGVLSPSGVDNRAAVQLRYPDGATAQYMVALDVATPNDMTIYTERAVVELPYFWGGTEMRINGRVFRFPPEHEGHHHEFVHAAECIRAGLTESSIMPLSETLAIQRQIDTLRTLLGVF